MDKGVRRRKGKKMIRGMKMEIDSERGLENELHSASLSRYRRFRRKYSRRAVFSSLLRKGGWKNFNATVTLKLSFNYSTRRSG